MIDVKMELREYSKINLDEIEAGGRQLTDDIRNSILLYNKAVDSLANGSEDIATIELKKAVSLNPHFYEALNLLGICYGYANDTEKAAEIFDRVVKGESNGVKAQKYLTMLKAPEQDTAKSRTAKKASPPAQGNTTPRRTADRTPEKAADQTITRRAAAKTGPAGLKKNDLLKYAACFAAGVVLALVLSLMFHKPESKALDPDSGKNTVAEGLQQSLNEYKTKYDELEGRYNQLQKDAEASNKLVEYYQDVMKLNEVERLSSAKQYENAADMLIQLKTVEFTGEDAEQFKKLNNDLMPKAAKLVYDDGVKLYNTGKYDEALKRLGKVQVYQPDFSRNDAVLYYQGKSFQQLKDSRNAIAAYQKLIDTYPKSSYVKNAKSRIDQLSRQP